MRTPILNHLALTVPRALVSDTPDRRALLEFYERVFGWRGIDVMAVDGERVAPANGMSFVQLLPRAASIRVAIREARSRSCGETLCETSARTATATLLATKLRFGWARASNRKVNDSAFSARALLRAVRRHSTKAQANGIQAKNKTQARSKVTTKPRAIPVPD